MNLFQNISSQMSTVILVIALIYYLLQCLFGYKIFKFTCAFVGFVAGFLIGLLLGLNLFHLETSWSVILGIAIGIVLALLAVKLFLVGVFLLAFSLAFSLALQIPFPETGNWNIFAVIIAAAIGVIIGMLAVRFFAPVIIIYTAISGSINAVAAFARLSGYISNKQPMYFAIVGILAAIGLIVQFIMNRKH